MRRLCLLLKYPHCRRICGRFKNFKSKSPHNDAHFNEQQQKKTNKPNPHIVSTIIILVSSSFIWVVFVANRNRKSPSATASRFYGRSLRDFVLLLVNGLLANVAYFVSFASLFWVRVGDLEALYLFITPTLTAAIGWVAYKEPFPAILWVVFAVNLAGTILITQPTFIFRWFVVGSEGGSNNSDLHPMPLSAVLSITVSSLCFACLKNLILFVLFFFITRIGIHIVSGIHCRNLHSHIFVIRTTDPLPLAFSFSFEGNSTRVGMRTRDICELGNPSCDDVFDPQPYTAPLSVRNRQ